MTTFAAIDIGTNSCRLLVAEKRNGKIIPLKRDLITTRLGEGVSKTGRLKAEAIQRTVRALQKFAGTVRDYKVQKIGVVATNAAREAENKTQFLQEVEEKTGLKVEIISGKKEALLSFKGAAGTVEVSNNPVVIDIGGGSTELIYKHYNDIKAVSARVGAVRCTEESAGPSKIFRELSEALENVNSLDGEIELVGVGGTITTLAAVNQKLKTYDPAKVHNYILRRDDVDSIFDKLTAMGLEERKRVPGLQPERADIIVAGTLILWVIMSYLHADHIVVSEADLLYGIIMEL